MSRASDADARLDRLAAEARAGSAASFAELVRALEAPLYRFLLLRTREPAEAEELCQQAFVRCWHKLHTWRPERAFRPWLLALARRVAASHLARRRRDASLDDAADPPSDALGPAAESSAREEAARLWDLAARLLDEAQRSALWLRYAEELSAREIGAVLDLRPAHVRVLLHRARRRLAEHLAQDDAAPDPAPTRPAPHPRPAHGAPPPADTAHGPPPAALGTWPVKEALP